MAEPCLSDADVCTWQTRAAAYVRRQGWPGLDADDLVQTMVLDVLEHPAQMLRMEYLYQHALDRLNPRGRVEDDGTRLRRSQRTVNASQLMPREANAPPGDWTDVLGATRPPESDPWAPQTLTRLLRCLPPSMARLLRAYYVEGCTEAALGRMYGVSESRISQRLAQAQQQLIYALHQDRRRHAAR